MDYRKLLKDEINTGLKLVNENYIPNKDYYNYVDKWNDNLFRDLPEEMESQLNKGDGNELVDGRYPAGIKSTASSTALMVNMLLSLNFDKFNIVGNHFYEYRVEEKLSTGLSNANLDGALFSKNAVIYIESKFTESYTDNPKNLKKSYIESNKINYRWKKFMKEFLPTDYINNEIITRSGGVEYKSIFDNYNGIQMILHALSIYTDVTENPEKYKEVSNIQLLNLVWKHSFDNKVLNEKDNLIKIELLETNFINKLQEFMVDLFCELKIDFQVVYKTYQDFVEEHKNEFLEGGYKYMKNRYYL